MNPFLQEIMDDWNSLYRTCLFYIRRNINEIFTFFNNQNINIGSVFSAFPPRVCESLLRFATSDLHPQIISYFFRRGIKFVSLEYYQHDLIIQDVADVYEGITRFNLEGATLSEENLKQLVRRLPNVKVLNLVNTRTTDLVLESIGITCRLLEYLNLSHCSITNLGLYHLCGGSNEIKKGCRYLKTINVNYTQVTIIGLVFLLENIDLWDLKADIPVNIHESVVYQYLKRNFGVQLNLRRLNLFPTGEEYDVIEILSSSPFLQTLSLYKIPITSSDLISLSRFRHLQRLSVTIDKNNNQLTFEEGIVGFLMLSGRQLRELRINNFEYVNVYLIGIYCENLRILELFSIRHLFFKKKNIKTCPKIFKFLELLKIKNMRNDPWDNCLQNIISSCYKLSQLEIISMSCLSDNIIFDIIPFLNTLKTLNISYCETVTRTCILQMIDSLPVLSTFLLQSRRDIFQENQQYDIKVFSKPNGSTVELHFVYDQEIREVPAEDDSADMRLLRFY